MGYFGRLLRQFGLSATDREIVRATESGVHFETVHADDIVSFVLDQDGILARFGDGHGP